MNQNNLFPNFQKYEKSNQNLLSQLLDENPTETAAKQSNKSHSSLSQLLDDNEVASKKNYKGNHLLFLETANNATDQLLTNFKYYGIV
ncbi:hypothetical protein, partial [Bacillus cereus group sp. BceL245]